MRRTLWIVPAFGFLAWLSAASPAGRAAGGEKEAAFRRYRAAFESLKRNHGDEAKKQKRIALEEIGELRYPPSVRFLGRVLSEEDEPSLITTALVALGKVGTVEAVQTAFRPAMNPRADDLFRDALPWGLKYAHDETAASWVARHMLRVGNARLRRAAVESLGVMACAAGVDALIKALEDRDVTVAYEAARALGRIGDARALASLHDLFAAKDWRLREAAAYALGHFEDEKGLGLLKTALLDDDWRVRESAVLSLKNRGNRDAVPALIRAVADENRRVAVEIRETLKDFTGKDFGFEVKLWQSWWRAQGKKQEGPAKPELTAPVVYHGIEVQSNRVLFIVDTSGSMDWGGRMGKAREELEKVVDSLEPRTMFNVMTFANGPLFFRKEMVPATEETLEDFAEWMAKQAPYGGTNTYDTLQRAIEEIPGVDTIFFLSDGIPVTGKYIAQEKILAEINNLNRFRKIRIHTIALLLGSAPAGVPEDKELAERFMKRLAEENQGEFISVK